MKTWLDMNYGNIEVKHDHDERITRLFDYLCKNRPDGCDIEDFFSRELLKEKPEVNQQGLDVRNIQNILRGMYIQKTRKI
ncbi:hypothetical protein AB6C70_25300 [Vibrio splendidus]|uniref:hypothetical protein n=1 Tax=Vibrio splendidus TaxID=29497 RepID=UPI0011B230E0|nr:hypothetical protein [Vibrio splendidus]